MDKFDDIYNTIIKQNRHNEKVFKSRLKKKFKDFIDGKNDIDICKLINYISKFNININKPIINAKPVDSTDTEKDKQIQKLTKNSKQLNTTNNKLQHDYNTLKSNYDKLKTDKDNIIKRKNEEIKDLEKKLCEYGDEDYLYAINY